MSQSIRRQAIEKPEKPRPDFPLFVHGSNYLRWAKKVRGKLEYFGPIDESPDHGAQAALERWLDEKDDLLAGRRPRKKRDGLTIGDLCTRFLNAKRVLAEQGRFSRRGHAEYRAVTDRIVATLGTNRLVEDLEPSDFTTFLESFPSTWAASSVDLIVARTRAVFNFAHSRNQQLIPKPVLFGDIFRVMSSKERRRLRPTNGERLFSADEIHTIMNAATPDFRAAILLGINCGFGNMDVARLPTSAIDLDAGWHTFPRPKTGEARRAKLWPETIEAIRGVLTRRPRPSDPNDSDLVFLTNDGLPWVRFVGKVWTDKVCATTTYVLGKIKMRHRGFYSLRRTFRTVADEVLDVVAINHIMGHVDGSMGAVYRQRLDDSRLVAVSDYVHRWLFGEAKPKRKASR
jgi:integrase